MQSPPEQITHNMETPATASWDLDISDADFEKLKTGFEAPDMDHRWEVIAKDADENGIISIYISRSWTGFDQYILDVKPNDVGSSKITSVTWNRIGADFSSGKSRSRRKL